MSLQETGKEFKDSMEEKSSCIHETDAFFADRLEMLLALAGLTTILGLALFLWYAIIRGHELWIIALVSTSLGLLIGLPMGRFFMPQVVAYINGLCRRMDHTLLPVPKHDKE